VPESDPIVSKKADAYRLFLFLECATALANFTAFTAMSLYEIQVAHLSPLQLVLVGTTVEASITLFEVPTGVVADVYSRRLSVIIGIALIGMGFLLEGLLPFFVTILLAQVLWGLGYTFTSGAIQAWVTDEIGEGRANRAFLRANQYGLGGALVGMLVAILIGGGRISLPILAGGGLYLLLAVILILVMPEHGFQPTPRQERNSFQQMAHTFRLGLQTVRRQPRLATILVIGLIYGLYSEGFDRLWIKHMLGTFHLPQLLGSSPIAWFGGMRMIGMLLSILATRLVERRLDTSQPGQIARLMLAVTGILAASLVAFALCPLLALTLAAYWLINVLRNVAGPLYTAWVNQRLDPRVRATVLSMSSQVDAIGQILGGPGVGLVASAVSVRAAIAVSGLLLTPALPLFGRAGLRQSAEKAAAEAK
jgi:DHA3 family tetracycline resistance protein-like MFS transporter